MIAPVTAGRVDVDQVRFHPRNVRRDLGDLRSLTESIRRVGVLQPITVDQNGDHLRLRAGHRRVAAARLAGVQKVPALIYRDALDDDEFMMLALHENTFRQGLTREDRQDAITALVAEGCTYAGLARNIGVSTQTIRTWAGIVKPSANRCPAPVKRAVLRALADDWERSASRGLSPTQATRLLAEIRQLADTGKRTHLEAAS